MRIYDQKLLCLGCWLVGLAMTYAVEANKPLVLVKDGRPVATLVLADKPRQATQLAVAEFQRLMEKMTGCRLPVATNAAGVVGTRVLIGESEATRALGYTNASFLAEEYCIKTGPDYLLIMGRDQDTYGAISYEKDGTYPGFLWHHDLGTLWGVLDFLERKCGVRWYLPGDIGEVAPKGGTLTIDSTDIRRRPWASHRFVVARPHPKKLYWYLGMPTLNVGDVADWRETNLWWLHQRMHLERLAHSHASYWFYDKFLKTHPEYFAQGHSLQQGVYGAQPAFHKPEVVQAIAQEAIEYFDLPAEVRDKPSSQRYGDYFSVSPEDNDKFCTSPEAKAKFDGPMPKEFWGGWSSRYVWDFVNEVARIVGKKHPDKWISCIAYWQYQEPYPGMKLEPNVMVQFARELPTDTWNPAIAAQNERALQAWVRLKPGRLFLYDFFCFPQHLKNCVFPGFIPHAAAADLTRMKRIGIRGAYNDIACVQVGNRGQYMDGVWVPAAWASPMLDFVNFYVWFKYLDDQSRDVDDILDEMFDRLYGPAGVHIKRFMTLAERIYTSWPEYQRTFDDQNHLDSQTSWTALCPPERLERFGRIMADAHAAAQTPEQKQRVQLFDDGVYQMMKNCSAAWLRDNPVLTPANSQALPDKWNFMPDPAKRGREQRWFAADLDDSAWPKVSISSMLEKQGIANYTQGWYRVQVLLPAERSGKKIGLRFGAVDETCWVWVNGKPAGEFIYDPAKDANSWEKPLRFDMTAYMIPGQTNQITVLIQNMVGGGGIWKPSQLLFE